MIFYSTFMSFPAGVISRPSRRSTAVVLARATCPPKRRTGGNDDKNNNGGNGGGSPWGPGGRPDDDERKKFLDSLRRTFYADRDVTVSSLVVAMRKRWGRPFRCELVEALDGSLAVEFLPIEVVGHADRDSLETVVAALNEFQIGPQFVDHIKYSPSMDRQPDSGDADAFVVPLDVPLSGPRVTEWGA